MYIALIHTLASSRDMRRALCVPCLCLNYDSQGKKQRLFYMHIFRQRSLSRKRTNDPLPSQTTNVHDPSSRIPLQRTRPPQVGRAQSLNVPQWHQRNISGPAQTIVAPERTSQPELNPQNKVSYPIERNQPDQPRGRSTRRTSVVFKDLVDSSGSKANPLRFKSGRRAHSLATTSRRSNSTIVPNQPSSRQRDSSASSDNQGSSVIFNDIPPGSQVLGASKWTKQSASNSNQPHQSAKPSRRAQLNPSKSTGVVSPSQPNSIQSDQEHSKSDSVLQRQGPGSGNLANKHSNPPTHRHTSATPAASASVSLRRTPSLVKPGAKIQTQTSVDSTSQNRRGSTGSVLDSGDDLRALIASRRKAQEAFNPPIDGQTTMRQASVTMAPAGTAGSNNMQMSNSAADAVLRHRQSIGEDKALGVSTRKPQPIGQSIMDQSFPHHYHHK